MDEHHSTTEAGITAALLLGDQGKMQTREILDKGKACDLLTLRHPKHNLSRRKKACEGLSPSNLIKEKLQRRKHDQYVLGDETAGSCLGGLTMEAEVPMTPKRAHHTRDNVREL